LKTAFLFLLASTILLGIFAFEDSFAEKQIKLHFGQTIQVDDLKFTLNAVDDSRCPADVTCMWLGQVIATIQIQNQTLTKTVDFVPNDSYTFFSPYKIILLDVSPYPISTEKPDDHIATLILFSLDGKPPCEKHMTVKDGLCVPKPKPSDFRVSGSNTSMLYAYSGLSLVGVIIGFFVIKKWKNRK